MHVQKNSTRKKFLCHTEFSSADLAEEVADKKTVCGSDKKNKISMKLYSKEFCFFADPNKNIIVKI